MLARFSAISCRLWRGRRSGAKVWAFEPNPENFRCALITAKINRLRNVELLNAGLGERRGSLPMVTTDKRGRSLGGASQIVRDVGQGTITVDVVTVDESIPRTDRYRSSNLMSNISRSRRLPAPPDDSACRPILVLEHLPAEEWLAKHLLPLGYRFSRKVHDNTVLRPD